MPEKLKLTWQPGSGGRKARWRKKYKSKLYFYSAGKGKSDREAYKSALQQWEADKVKIDANARKPHEEEYEQEIEKWDKVLTWSRRHSDEETADWALTKLSSLRIELSNPRPQAVDKKDTFDGQFDRSVLYPGWTKMIKQVTRQLDAALKNPNYKQASSQRELSLTNQDFSARKSVQDSPIKGEVIKPSKIETDSPDPLVMKRMIWQDRLDAMSRTVMTDQTLKAHVTKFMTAKKAAAKAGDITAGRVEKLRTHLAHFQDWIGPNYSVSEITSPLLMDYHRELLRNVEAKKWKRRTASDHLSNIKSFIRWLWEIEAIESLPRVLAQNSKTLEIGKSSSEIITFENEEIHRLLVNASLRTRLYILLMLNCGMTQKDIADLQWKEVDWETGRIKRKRSKTKNHENVPTVDYQLWPETIALLLQERSKAGKGPVLLNANGQPLWRDGFKDDDKYSKNDNIRTAFGRLIGKLKIKKSSKFLKKTSASMLRNNKNFQGLEDLFLGHAPQTMSDQHYAKPPTELLEEAIKWLREEYGIADLELV